MPKKNEAPASFEKALSELEQIVTRLESGDLPLEEQGRLLALLDAPRRIGLTLTGGGMLVPVKSIVALAGLRTGEPAGVSRICGGKCASCGKSDCPYRAVLGS